MPSKASIRCGKLILKLSHTLKMFFVCSFDAGLVSSLLPILDLYARYANHKCSFGDHLVTVREFAFYLPPHFPPFKNPYSKHGDGVINVMVVVW